MKSKNLLRTYLFVSFLVIIVPFLLDILINNNILMFSLGAVDTLIGFWGSYIGALIGASVVYFVAKVQIKQQGEQQIDLLKLRAQYETKKEMEFYNTTTLMFKTEELINVLDELLYNIQHIFSDMIYISGAFSVLEGSNDPELINYLNDHKSKRDQYIRRCKQLFQKVEQLSFYLRLNEQKVKIINHGMTVIHEYKNIHVNYKKYLIDIDEDNHKVSLFGVAAEASNEIYEISNMLHRTLTNIQDNIMSTKKAN